MEITKKIVLKQVLSLYLAYKRNRVSHTFSTCKLCKIYNDEGYVHCSPFCLNSVFKLRSELDLFCVSRSFKYPNLNFDRSENNTNLYNFWREVYFLIKKSDNIEVLTTSGEFKKNMLKIAEKYK